MGTPEEDREEIKFIKRRLAEGEREFKEAAKREEKDKEMIQFNIRIVRFRNLSSWLKTIVVFGWVVALFFGIFFITAFLAGIL